MPIVHESLVAMLAELAREAAIIITSYMDDDERCENPVLKHYGPFSIQVHGVDGHLATFYEEGIEFFPETKDSAE